MRSLSFGTTETDRDRFDILYGGACVSPRGVARTELNTFNGLMKKMEEIGKPIEGVAEQAQCKFELSDEGGQVLLEEQEYRLLNEMHDMVKWTKNFAGKAEEAYKWFAAIPKTTLKKVQGTVTETPEEPESAVAQN